MHIAVCLKQVMRRGSHLRVDDARPWVREGDASWELNEPDAYALEEALRLRERHGGDVTAVSAGPPRVIHVLREALARGADRAVHVDGPHLALADGPTVASALAAGIGAIEGGRPDLVLTGLQSDDQGWGQVGVMLAERLDATHATIVMEVQIDAGRVRVKRELEGGWFQWVAMPLPAVLTIQSGINHLRYATLKGIMAAKKKEIRVVAASAPETPRLRILSLAVPARVRQVQMIGGTASEAARELVRRLREQRAI
jgi:electron transfer flavoprotein beta subunit